MKNTLLTAGLVLVCATAASAQEGHDDWYADYDQAVAVAREQGKDLFVDFTGSDWCGWCIRLHAEVFDHDEFLAPVKEKFVLVALDFPNGDEAKAKVPSPERNDELQAKYGISGFPTCLLMTPDGVVFGRMGYQEGGPEKYAQDLFALTTKGKEQLEQLSKLTKAFEAAEDKTPVVEQAIAMLVEMDAESAGVTVVADMALQGLTLDPENKIGLKLRAVEALLAAGQANAEVLTAAHTLDPKNESGLFEAATRAQFGTVRDETSAKAAVTEIEALLAIGTFHDADEVKQMTAMAAMWCNGPLGDTENAVVLATRANAIEGDIDPRMQEMLDKLLQ